MSAIDTPIILINAKNVTWQGNINPDNLRVAEKEIVAIMNGDFVSIFDLRS